MQSSFLCCFTFLRVVELVVFGLLAVLYLIVLKKLYANIFSLY